MLLKYQVEGEERQLQWLHLQPPYRLLVGDQEVEVVHHRPGLLLLKDGRCLRYTSTYSAAGREWTVQFGGQVLSLKAQRSRGGEAADNDGSVKSPMNGVVVKLQATPGQHVEAGQVILVLEAMKMENEVTAPIAGKLERCEVSVGQVVTANQFLFEVVPGKES
jgi:biotin carboxyl carrier protein